MWARKKHQLKFRKKRGRNPHKPVRLILPCLHGTFSFTVSKRQLGLMTPLLSLGKLMHTRLANMKTNQVKLEIRQQDLSQTEIHLTNVKPT